MKPRITVDLPREEPMPERMGDFRIRGLLGRGGTGLVYDAEWGPRRVALKVLHRAESSKEARLAERFRREAELLSSLSHPGIVKVLSSGSFEDGRPYLVMEKLEGRTLDALLSDGPISWRELEPLFLRVAQAIEALHKADILHRDIKAENVFVVEPGGHPVLLDVGIAQGQGVSPRSGAGRVTREEAIVGTPAYMAPERCFGAEASRASDVYELALMLYRLLAGRLPWTEGEGSSARLHPQPLASLVEGLPDEVDAAVMQALRPSPDERQKSIAELLATLGCAEAETEPPAETPPRPKRGTDQAELAIAMAETVARPAVPSTPSQKAAQSRGRILRWTALLVVVAGATTAAVLWYRSGRSSKAVESVDPDVMSRMLCAEGSAADCYRLARMFQSGEGSIQDDELAQRMFVRACDAGKGDLGCLEAAAGFQSDNALERDMPRAAQLLEKACEGGVGEGCAQAAKLFEEGKEIVADLERALDLDLRACELEVASSCTRAGYAYSEATGTERDYERANQLFERACEEGHMLGCFDLGYAYLHAQGVAEDFERAAELFDQACRGGNRQGCSSLGQLYEKGQGVTRNFLKAASLYQDACLKGSTSGCSNLGRFYDNGIGVAEDDARAAHYYEWTCEQDPSKACNNLALLYLNGSGVAKNRAKGIELFERYCDAGQGLGCRNLAITLLEGKPSEEDRARAAALHARACELGQAKSCK